MPTKCQGRSQSLSSQVEPEEEVDLLVDDVQREHAQRVELLLASRSAHAVERATESKRG